jgi:hypothetical protein
VSHRTLLNVWQLAPGKVRPCEHGVHALQ